MSKAVVNSHNFLTGSADKTIRLRRNGGVLAAPATANPNHELYWQLSEQKKALQKRINEIEIRRQSCPRHLIRQLNQEKRHAEREITTIRKAMNAEHLKDFAQAFVAVARRVLSEDLYLKIDTIARQGLQTSPGKHFVRDTGIQLVNTDGREQKEETQE